MKPATPQIAEFHAPARWQVVDFISDLHLQPAEPQTLEAWERYMAHTQADAVFILGDLFEVWIGDDAVAAGQQAHAGFEQHCADILRAASRRRPVFFMHGNRDFLLGPQFADSCGMTLLADPCVLVFGSRRWLLSHGDALCLDDTEYQQFRTLVRNPDWKEAFLAKPLSERRAIAQGLRAQSEARKRSGASYADADALEVQRWLQAAQATELIHGHTHRPADHDLGGGRHRRVLSDWDGATVPARAQVLRLRLGSGPNGHCSVQRLGPSQAC
jgi:UDP-2,3-diacylglucosamine hydrolase